MKIKQDFITNSSSTSYVISTADKYKLLEKDNILIDMLFELLNPKIFTDVEDVKKFTQETYGFGEEDIEYIKMVEVIKNGGSIIYFSIPYGGDVGFSQGFLEKHKSNFIIGED